MQTVRKMFDPKVTFPYSYYHPEQLPKNVPLRYTFPKDFIWGVATSSYQIEGAWNEDDKGESIWDRFSHTPGKVKNGHTGDIACDHYHRWPEDIAIMKALNLRGYRMSVAWPRILPEGTGKVNPKGLDFYDRLIDALLAENINPYVTLYHWDLPIAIEEKSGWLNRDIARYFSDYAQILFRCLGDRVKYWITINEPSSIVMGAYALGNCPPQRADYKAAMQVSHHINLAHGWAVSAFRAMVPDGKIGIVISSTKNQPADRSGEALCAAELYNQVYSYWYADPILRGEYPAGAWAVLEKKGWTPKTEPNDLKEISPQIDFLGLNYYLHRYITPKGSDPITGTGLLKNLPLASHLDWEILPEGIYETIEDFNRRYGSIPIYITENGLPSGGPKEWMPDQDDSFVPSYVLQDAFEFADENPDSRQFVRDDLRIMFLRDHLTQLHRTIQAGFDVRGYFLWTLCDNFEWSMGNSMRFGIVRLVPDTLDRVVKKSGIWYSMVARDGGFI